MNNTFIKLNSEKAQQLSGDTLTLYGSNIIEGELSIPNSLSLSVGGETWNVIKSRILDQPLDINELSIDDIIKYNGSSWINITPNSLVTSVNWLDNQVLYFGTNNDAGIFFDGSDLKINLINGDLILSDNGSNRLIFSRTTGDLSIIGNLSSSNIIANNSIEIINGANGWKLTTDTFNNFIFRNNGTIKGTWSSTTFDVNTILYVSEDVNIDGNLNILTGVVTAIGGNSSEWNNAYTNRISSFTTTGNSGVATLTGNTLNIPNYTLAGLGYIGALNANYITDNNQIANGANYITAASLPTNYVPDTGGTFSGSVTIKASADTALTGLSVERSNTTQKAYFNNWGGATNFLSDLTYKWRNLAATSLMELNGSGELTANLFIKSGGTASQFLKADGSLDSSVYLTAETDTLQSVTDRGAVTTRTITISPSGNNNGIILNGAGSGIALSIAHSGSGNQITGSNFSVNNAGVLTANSLIKSGGLSTQFLKADGTVDSSVYITAAALPTNYVPNTGGTFIGDVDFSTNVRIGTSSAHSLWIQSNIASQNSIQLVNGRIDSFYGGEANPRFRLSSQITGGGISGFGFGVGSSALDTFLYRLSFNHLKTDGDFTATSFIRSGGTSSQFLKADGSIDSSVYITAASLPTDFVSAASGGTFGGNITINKTGDSELTIQAIGSGASSILTFGGTNYAWNINRIETDGNLRFRYIQGAIDVLTLDRSGNASFYGIITGNGSGITNVNATTLNGFSNYARLSVTNNFSASQNIIGNTSSITDATLLTLKGTGENIGNLNFDNAFGTMVRLKGTKEGDGSAADEGLFSIDIATNAVLANVFNVNRFGINATGTITTTGNMGVGVASPSSDAIVRYIHVKDALSAGIVLEGTRKFSIYSSSSSSLVFRDETGATTLGTLSATGLNIIGDLTATTDVIGRYIKINGTTGTYPWLIQASGGADEFAIYSNTALAFRLTINTSGVISGNGAGLTNVNALTLGGLSIHAGTNNEVNKIVRTDSNGYLQAGWINTTSGDNGTSTLDRIFASSDSYIRYYTPANFIAALNVYGGINASTVTVNTSTTSTYYPLTWNAGSQLYNSTTDYLTYRPSDGTLKFRWLQQGIGGTLLGGDDGVFTFQQSSHPSAGGFRLTNNAGADQGYFYWNTSGIGILGSSGYWLVQSTASNTIIHGNQGGGSPILYARGTNGVGGGGRSVGISMQGITNDTGGVVSDLGVIYAYKENATQGDSKSGLSLNVNTGSGIAHALYFDSTRASYFSNLAYFNGTNHFITWGGSGFGMGNSVGNVYLQSSTGIKLSAHSTGVTVTGDFDLTGVIKQSGNFLFTSDSTGWIHRSNHASLSFFELQNNAGTDYGGLYAGATDIGFVTPSASAWRLRVDSSNHIDVVGGRVNLNGLNSLSNAGDGWLRLNDSASYGNGVYTPSLIRADGGFSVASASLSTNTTTPYGQWQIGGSQGTYGGILDVYSGVATMFDNTGNGGWYRQASGAWSLYWNQANLCLGIGTSTTNASYSIYAVKGAYLGGSTAVNGNITLGTVSNYISFGSISTYIQGDAVGGLYFGVDNSWNFRARPNALGGGMEVNGNLSTIKLRVENSSSSYWEFDRNDSTGSLDINDSGGSVLFSLSNAGNVTASNFVKGSDSSLKIEKDSSILSIKTLRKVEPKMFLMKSTGELESGYFADLLPKELDFVRIKVGGIYTMKYDHMIALNSGAIKDVDSEVQVLKKRINELEKEVNRLRNAS